MKFRGLLCSLSLCMLSACLQADVSESFDYEAGSLIGQNGGSGWSSAWRNAYSRNGGNYVVSDQGLTFGSITSSGNAAYSPGDGTRYQRDLDVVYDEGVVQVSFLMQCSSSEDDPYSALELQFGQDADNGRIFQIGILRKDDGFDTGNAEFYATVRTGPGGGRLDSIKIADFDTDTHRFLVSFDLDTDVASIFFDPTANTDLSKSDIELPLYENFTFDRIGLANFVGANGTTIDEIVVNYTGIDNLSPAIDAQDIDPAGMVFEWAAPTDPNVASVSSYIICVDPNEADVVNTTVASLDYYENNIPGSQTVSSPVNSLSYNTTYKWQVKANVNYNDSTTGVVSGPVWAFTTKQLDVAPVVNAGDNILTTIDLAGAPLSLNASVVDDGTTQMTILWQAFEISADCIATANVEFDDPEAVDTTITVSAIGTYVLKLTATDDTGSVSDMIEMRVYEDGCRAAKAAGNWQANYYDRNGDCIVDINDFAQFAIEWFDSTELSETATYSANFWEPVDTNEALIADVWIDIAGTDVEQLIAAPKFSQAPDFSYQVTGELRGMDIDNNTGQRIRGYIVPPVSGSYTFYIASDDKSRLFLSSDTTAVDTDPALANHIAEVSEYSDVDQWDKYPEQASAPIALTAGEYYYIEILHKELHVDTHVSVGWSTDGGATIEVIPGTALRSCLP